MNDLSEIGLLEKTGGCSFDVRFEPKIRSFICKLMRGSTCDKFYIVNNLFYYEYNFTWLHLLDTKWWERTTKTRMNKAQMIMRRRSCCDLTLLVLACWATDHQRQEFGSRELNVWNARRVCTRVWFNWEWFWSTMKPSPPVDEQHRVNKTSERLMLSVRYIWADYLG